MFGSGIFLIETNGWAHSMHPLTAFYSGQGTDHRGRSFNSILAFPDTELEICHDYIQWLFPLHEPSPYNPEAPVVTDEVIADFRHNAELQSRMHQALQRMLTFLGMVMRESPQGFELGLPTDICDRPWLGPENHNFRRISRMLASLKLMGLDTQAHALWQGLQVLALRCEGKITPATLTYWRLAAMRFDDSM